MKRNYESPVIKIWSLDKEEILTDSTVAITEKAIRSGGLKINGNTLDEGGSIVSVVF